MISNAEASKRYRERYPERVRESKKKWAAKNKERIRGYVRTRDKETTKWHKLKSRYGITKDQYYLLLWGQGKACPICGADVDDNENKPSVIDHCHETGEVRGILCYSCNIGLGMFRDKISLLKRAVNYLQKDVLYDCPV